MSQRWYDERLRLGRRRSEWRRRLLGFVIHFSSWSRILCSRNCGGALLLDCRLHQSLCEAFVHLRAIAMAVAARLVAVAIYSRAAVVNEGADTAFDLPLSISRAGVGVVEDSVVIMVITLIWQSRNAERVVYGAVEGGHG